MALVPARIDLWTVDLAGPAPSEALLSPAERARADRFRFARDRHRYLVAHDAMRRILGAALGVAPGTLVFDHGPQGKPALAGSPSLHFNLSHSEDLAVLAVTTHGPIGVDVEAVRPIPEFDAVAEAHFSPAELTALRALPAAERETGFYRLWTRKEAYIKAIGTGLSHPLGRFTVTLEADDARFLDIDDDASRARRWSIVPLALPSPFVGAVVFEAAAPTVTLRSHVR